MSGWKKEKIVALLEESARIAAEYKTKMSPETKSDKTIVTQADKAIEHFLDQAFTDEENNVYVIGEESLGTCDLKKALAHTSYIIDPIDGTAVYASGLPMWGISIGYAVGGKLQEGAIWEIFITLPEPTQQYDLMDWLVDELEERTPSEVEIVAKAYKIAEEFKEIKEK